MSHQKKDNKDNKDNKGLPVKDLQLKCDEYLAGWKRAQADYANLEREMNEKRKIWIKMANEDLLGDLLPIYDNLKLALKHADDGNKESEWVKGVSHIADQFKKFLKDLGVEEIKTVGEEFDTGLHEAVESKGEDNIIKKEIKSGYTLNGKVLYPAKVII